MGTHKQTGLRAGYVFILIFLVMAIGIVAIGYRYYRNYEQHFRGEVEEQLSSIADLKVDELAHWRAERLGDANVLFKNENISDRVRRCFETSEDIDNMERLRLWLTRIHDAYRYDRIFLLDAHGVERMSVPDTAEPVDPHLLRDIPEILRSNKVAFLDFHRDSPDGPLHLAVLVPLLDSLNNNIPIGLLVLRIDPEEYLYPYISRWPTVSRTAETLLVRREGDEAVYLNELRFQKNAALNMRISLDKTEVPAVKAVLGQEGIVEGLDYRGAPVIAAIRAVPNSPWFLVARIDKSEVYAPLRKQLWGIILLIGAILMGAGAGVGMIWRNQRARFYRAKYESAEVLRESEERYRLHFENVADVIYSLDSELRVTSVSPSVEAILGYTPGELVGKKFTDLNLLAPESLEEAVRDTLGIYSGEKITNAEYEFISKDGTRVLAAISGAPLYKDEKVVGLVAVARDITEQKRAENAISESEERFRTLFEQAADCILLLEIIPGGIPVIRDANSATFQILGYSHSEMIGKPVSFLSANQNSLEPSKEKIQRLISGESIVFEDEHRCKDGAIRVFECSLKEIHVGSNIFAISVERDITERKKTEQALRESEERYRLLADNTDTGFVVIDDQGIVIVANDPYQRIVGAKEAEDIIGHSVIEWTAPEEQEKNAEAVALCLRQGFIKDFETVYQHDDGTRVHIIISATAQESPAGGKQIVSFCHDITERKKVEQALYESEQRYRIINDNMSDTVWLMDMNLQTTWISPSVVRTRGYTLDELRQMPLDRHLTPESLAKAFPLIQTNLTPERLADKNDEISVTVELEYYRKDGSSFWADTIMTLLRDERGVPTGILGTGRDITERKRTEDALADEAIRRRILVEQSKDGIVVLDQNGKVYEANQRYAEMLGYTREEVQQLHIWDWDFQWPREQLLEMIRLVDETGDHFETIHRRKDGSLLDVEISTNGAVCSGQKLVFCVCRDISVRKRAEEALRLVSARNEAILAAVPDIIAEVDTNKVYTWVNKAGLEFFGEDVIGHAAADYFIGEQDTYKIVQSLFDGDEIITYVESWQRSKEGQKRLLAWWCRVLKDSAGKVTGALSTGRDITERKRAEEKLRESESRFREFFATSRDTVFIASASGKLIDFNDAALEMFGYENREELAQVPISSIYVNPKERFVLLALVEKQGYVKEYPVQMRRKDGAVIDALITSGFRRKADGSENEFFGTIRDITESKRAEEALADSEKRFRFLNELGDSTRAMGEPKEIMATVARMLGVHLRASRCAYADVDEDGDRFTIQHDYTDGCASTVGNYRLSLFGPRAVSELGDDRALVINDMDAELSPREGADMFNSIGIKAIICCPLVKQGTLRAMMAVHQTTARRWTPGEISLVEEVTDRCWAIIERTRAEQALRESEQRYRVINDNMSDTIWVMDMNLQTTWISPSTVRAYGYTLDELRQLPAERHIAPESGAKLVSLMQTNLTPERLADKNDEISVHVELELYRKDGSSFWADTVATLLRDERGAPTGFLSTGRDITESKRAEQSLHDSEIRYRRLFEAAKDGILILDAETGMILDANPFLITMLGFSHEEFRGKSIWDIGFLKDVFQNKANFLELQRKGYVRYEDMPLETVDGRRMDVEFVSNVYEVDHQKVIQCNIRDITERKLAKEALLDAKKNWEETFNSINDSITLHDKDFNILLANRAAKELFGEKLENIIGGKCYALYHKTDHPPIMCPSCDSLKTGLPSISETFEPSLNKYIEIKAFPKLDANGKIMGMVHVVRDITERKLAEQALATQKRIGEIFLTIPDDEIFNEALKVVLDLMKSPYGIFGYIDEAGALVVPTLTRDIWDKCQIPDKSFTFPRDTWGDSAWPRAIREKRIIIQNEVSTKAPEGHIAMRRHVSLPILFHGEAIGLFQIANRETDYTEVEVRILKIIADYIAPILSARLRRERAEAEAERMETQFIQSQKLESVGRLAGGVAHDFNNLLTVINTYSSIAINELKESDPLRADMEEIHKAGQRAAALTRQLLAFSRKQVIQPEVLNLNKAISELEKMLPRLIGEDIELAFRLADDLGNVKADPGQIEQVIMNLAVNARDAMPNGGKLTIETRNVDLDEEYTNHHVATQPGAFVMLAVSDTGMGMDEATSAQIFEPFFTTKEKGKGTGLGLSTVYGIVKQSGGNIWVYSEPGKGTTFKIYLPWVEEKAREERRKRPQKMSMGSETILIVEDETEVRNLTKRILEEAGYNILTAANGGEAFFLCKRQKEPIHMILTDVVMPGMSGRELSERLKQIQPGIKVLYMSGYTDNSIVHHGVLEEGTNFIGKPFTVEDLRRKVRDVLDGVRA